MLLKTFCTISAYSPGKISDLIPWRISNVESSKSTHTLFKSKEAGKPAGMKKLSSIIGAQDLGISPQWGETELLNQAGEEQFLIR